MKSDCNSVAKNNQYSPKMKRTVVSSLPPEMFKQRLVELCFYKDYLDILSTNACCAKPWINRRAGLDYNQGLSGGIVATIFLCYLWPIIFQDLSCFIYNRKKCEKALKKRQEPVILAKTINT